MSQTLIDSFGSINDDLSDFFSADLFSEPCSYSQTSVDLSSLISSKVQNCLEAVTMSSTYRQSPTMNKDPTFVDPAMFCSSTSDFFDHASMLLLPKFEEESGSCFGCNRLYDDFSPPSGTGTTRHIYSSDNKPSVPTALPATPDRSPTSALHHTDLPYSTTANRQQQQQQQQQQQLHPQPQPPIITTHDSSTALQHPQHIDHALISNERRFVSTPTPGCESRKRSHKKSVDKSADDYVRRRMRNNIAVRKSRDKAKRRSQDTQDMVKQLQNENNQLKKRMDMMSKELTVFKGIFTNAGLNTPELLSLE